MNKLLSIEGGQPLFLSDFDFLQGSYAEALKGIISSLGIGTQNLILSGCEVVIGNVQGGTHTVSFAEGFIAIQGEVYKVFPGNISVSENYSDVYWKVVKTTKDKYMFENGSEHEVHEVAIVQLSSHFSEGDTYVSYKETKTYKNILRDLMKEFILQSGEEERMNTVLPAGANAAVGLHYKKNIFGMESIEFSLLVAEPISLPVVSEKRRLFTFDISVKNINARVSAMYNLDQFNSSKFINYVFSFENGACYVYDSSGNPLETLPKGALLEIKFI